MIPKFRFWDKQELNFVAYLNNIVLKYDGTIEGIEYEMTGEGNVYNDISYFEVMQSTGLKDKNGVEIFEGDILKIFVLGNEGAIAKVIFKNGMFGIEDDMYGYGYDKGLYSLHQILSLRDVEILGNKFEHPNLLEE